MSLPKYSEYKKTNLDWLTEVPAHWNIQSCRGVLTNRNEKNKPLINKNYLSLMANVGVILYEEKGDVGNKKPEDLGKCKQVYPGDLVINSMNYGIGSYGLSKYRGVCSPVYIVLKPKLDKVEERYVFRILEIKKFQQYAQSFGNGILEHRAAISWDILKNIKLPLPPIEEQRKIIQFLDIEIAKIDNLLLEQEKLVQLMKERLDALVLNSFEAKDTTQNRLVHSVEVIKRPVIQEEGEMYEPLGLFNRGRGLFHKELRAKTEMGDSDFFWIEEGDLIISGQFAWEGSVALAYSEENGCVVSHRYPVIRGKSEIVLTEYLFAIFTTSYGEFLLNQCSVGAAGRNRPLNLKSLLKEVIPIPNLKTQRKIADLVHDRRNLIQEINRQSNLVNDRRAAIVLAAVTGGIDVRNYRFKESV